MKNPAQYMQFGTLLARLRREAGFSQQTYFAKVIKTTQQTVSRWESGLSRPRHKEIAVIATVLKADHAELLAAAGYLSKKIVITSFDQPFPVDALKPDSFERFCLYFLAKLYSSSTVHRAGDSGHTQEGIDIDVILSNKSVYTFQCKRVQQFGPKDVHAAVAKHARKAKKKFLLLSRISSPQARAAILQHHGWDIWDKEDISREIRQRLSKEEQIRLVDSFFPGQRFALLGEREAGPWQTAEEFFEPFMAGGAALSHKWKLISRIEETQKVVEALSNSNKQAVFLVGSGGSGKTRVLKEAVDVYLTEDGSAQVRFLSPRRDITEKSLEDLGSGKKVLIVDDAHDENNLQLLFQYAAAPSNNAKLVLVFRPYGLDYLKSQASCFALSGDHIAQVELKPLSLAQATELASYILRELSGPIGAAKQIARLTLDCPLATVIAAQIVAKDKINHIELAKNEEDFRRIIFGKFQDIIAGSLGRKGENELIRKLLKVLALIQPFHPDDTSVAAIAEQVEGVRAHETNSLIRRLVDAGVLFKRGGNFRLAPDLLADFIIEESCIGHSDASTGYAEKVFDSSGESHIKNILLNLGKLDWRRADGFPSNSKLLDGIWQKLKPTHQYYDPCIDAVTSVAYYQPDRALKFVEQLMQENRYLTELPGILKYVAYSMEHLHSACELLWELGKYDSRELNQHPEHAIRILTEMCGVERNKPLAYNEVVVDIALSLIEKSDSWNHPYSPFDILRGILQSEGRFTEFEGRSFRFGSFPIPYSKIAPLREKVIGATLKLLLSSNTRIAVRAARFLEDGLRYYSKFDDKERFKPWEEAFIKTLNAIEQVVTNETLDPLVLIEIARSVSWHANYATNQTTNPIGKRIIKALPNSLRFRTTLALVDGYGRIYKDMEYTRCAEKWDQHLGVLTEELLVVYPDGEQLLAFIENIIKHVATNLGYRTSSARNFYDRMINSSKPFAQATVNHAIANPDSEIAHFADKALSNILKTDHENALIIVSKFLSTNSRVLHIAIGNAYSAIDFNLMKYSEKDIVVLKKVLESKDEWVARCAIQAIRGVAKNDQRLAIDLLKCVEIGRHGKVADEVLMYFQRKELIPFGILFEEDIGHFLDKLMQLPELDEYWIEVFLSKCSKHHAKRTASFFMKRVEHAAEKQDWNYRPCNYGPYCHVPLRFRDSDEFGLLLREVAQWMKSAEENFLFQQRAGELFGTMFHPFDTELVNFLQIWLDMATPADMRLISQILSEAPNNVVFEHWPFIIRFLEKAKSYGKDLLDSAISALIGSAVSGIKSGAVGEPFPQDLKLKEDAEKILGEIPSFSPAYRLYDNLRKHAEQCIERSIREAEQFDE